MTSPDPEIAYTLKAVHTTQYYRLQNGVLYYRTAKSNIEHAFPLAAVQSQKWRRYFDGYFWWGLLIAMVGLIYFSRVAELGSIRFELRHVIFAAMVIVGVCQAIYWARFPQTLRLVTSNGDSIGIFVDAKDPSRSKEFIEAVQREIEGARTKAQS